MWIKAKKKIRTNGHVITKVVEVKLPDVATTFEIDATISAAFSAIPHVEKPE